MKGDNELKMVGWLPSIILNLPKVTLYLILPFFSIETSSAYDR